VIGAPWLPRNPPPVNAVADLRAQLGARTRPGTAGTTAPQPSVSLSRVDRAGRLWFIAQIPFREGTRLSGPLASCEGSPGTRGADWRWCTLIEIVDPARRGLVVSQQIDATPRFIPNTDLACTMSEDSLGIVRLTVWRVRLAEDRGNSY
jgi:hypothetical protein